MMDDLIFSKLISTVTSKNQEKEEKKEKCRNIRKKRSSERKRNGIHSTSFHSFHSLWICVAMLLLHMMKSCEAFDKLPNGNGQISPSARAGSLGGVVDEWIKGDAARATVVAKYGEIEIWDTSDIISMKYVFYGKTTFNEDISKWNVSSVRTMDRSTSLSFFSLSVLVFINIFYILNVEHIYTYRFSLFNELFI